MFLLLSDVISYYKIYNNKQTPPFFPLFRLIQQKLAQTLILRIINKKL